MVCFSLAHSIFSLSKQAVLTSRLFPFIEHVVMRVAENDIFFIRISYFLQFNDTQSPSFATPWYFYMFKLKMFKAGISLFIVFLCECNIKNKQTDIWVYKFLKLRSKMMCARPRTRLSVLSLFKRLNIKKRLAETKYNKCFIWQKR